MPKINIREMDKTGSEKEYGYLENLTLIPGVRIRQVEKNNNTAEVISVVEGLFTDVNSFITKIETAMESQKECKSQGAIDPETHSTLIALDLNTKRDYGFIYSCYLLSQGIPVYYVPAYTESDLLSAEDTMSITPSQFVTAEVTDTEGNVTTKEVLSSHADEETTIVTGPHYMFDFNTFTDRGLYDIRFITIAGLEKDEFLSKAMLAAATRGDSALITSAPSKGEQFLKVTYNVTVDGVTEEKIINLPKTDATNENYVIDKNGELDTTQLIGNIKKFSLNTSKKIDNWVQGKYSSVVKNYITKKGYTWSASESKEQIGKYAAIFASNSTTDLTIVGTKNNYTYNNLTVPADFVYLTTYANMISNKNEYHAVAGPEVGISPLNPTPLIKFGDSDVDLFEAREEVDNIVNSKTSDKVKLTVDGNEITGYIVESNSVQGHVAINPICNINPFGNIIWGNRTMYALQAPENGSSTKPQLVASSFLNIRNLIISIKKRLYRVSRQFSFAPNSDTLWINFKAAITPLLENMLHNEGIRGYSIDKVATSKKALVAAKINIIPIEAVEDFDLTVELTDSLDVNE